MRTVHHVDPTRRGEILRALADELAREPTVMLAVVHGSFLGDGGFHDLDVGVHFGAVPTAELTSASLALAERLARGVGLPVDVRPLNVAPLPFLFHALRGRLLLSRDDELLCGLMERTAPRYHDLAPVLRRATVEAFGA